MTTRITLSPSEPRKTPRQGRSRITVAAIIEGSARILEEKGFDGFNTNAVAEKADVSIGTLYQYFPDRRALLVELTRRERSKLKKEMTTALSKGGSLHGILNSVLQIAVTCQLARPALSRTLDLVEPSLALTEETLISESSLVVEIRQLLASHAFADPEVTARDIVMMTKSLIDAAGLAGETDQSALLERVKRAVFGYLFADRADAPRALPGA